MCALNNLPYFSAWYYAFRGLITISGLFLMGGLLLGFIYIFCRDCTRSWLVGVIIAVLLVSSKSIVSAKLKIEEEENNLKKEENELNSSIGIIRNEVTYIILHRHNGHSFCLRWKYTPHHWPRCVMAIYHSEHYTTISDRCLGCPIIYMDINSQWYFVHRHLNNACYN